MIVTSPGRLWIASGILFTAFAALALLAPAESGAASRPADVSRVATPTERVGPDPANYDVSCPRGLKAVGGGFNTFGYATSGPGGGFVTAVVPVVIESRRLNARTWRVTERAAENPVVASLAAQGTTVEASVYCRRVKGPVTAVEGVGALSTSSSSPSSADPKCPKGTVALAGGWSITAASSGFAYPSVYESFRDGARAWKSSAVPGSQPSVGLLGFAYCARAKKPPRRQEVMGSGTIFARCPNKLTASAGGFQAAPGSFIQVSTGSTGGKKHRSHPPGTPFPAGPTWATGSGGIFGTTTGFAYCS